MMHQLSLACYHVALLEPFLRLIHIGVKLDRSLAPPRLDLSLSPPRLSSQNLTQRDCFTPSKSFLQASCASSPRPPSLQPYPNRSHAFSSSSASQAGSQMSRSSPPAPASSPHPTAHYQPAREIRVLETVKNREEERRRMRSM